jgi:phage repressor protein C with HTH and peptisase S24 domain
VSFWLVQNLSLLFSVEVRGWVGAGTPKALWESEPVEHRLVPAAQARPSIVGVKVAGDSMAPLIADGAVVGVDREATIVVDGKVYLVYIPDEGITLKRAFLGAEGLLLRSDNPLYPEIVLPRDLLRDRQVLLGRVCWVHQEL